jgi:lipopolysaccharide transport system ATP-binding protein
MSNITVKVENLGKEYQLGTIGYGSLKHDFQAWFSRILGKEDPNKKIDENGNIQKHHKDLNETFWALQDVNFDIKQGDTLGIIGNNGAGKSTLLKILSRITTPTQGVVKVKGRIASLLEVGTGFHPDLTGRENVFLNGSILGMKKKEIASKFDEIVAFSGIEKFIDTPVKRYSSGMYVRLAFSVAAHLESEVMILDEVLAVGDIDFQQKCLTKIKAISQDEGRTVIFVSHGMQFVDSLCKRALLLSGGHVEMLDDTHKVIKYYMDKEHVSSQITC